MKPGSLTRKLSRVGAPSVQLPVDSPGGTNDTLAALREQMARLLVRDSAPSTRASQVALEQDNGPRPVVGFGMLPVSQLHTDAGIIWRKLWRVPLEYRVGLAACHHVQDASWAQLSLLALAPDLVTTCSDELLFLDTETTGLGGAGTLAFLVGLAFVEDGDFWVEQILLEGPEQEPALLAHLKSRLANRPVVVSFNGKTFDWPLLAARYTMNRMPAPAPPRHFDLLHVARRLHKARLGSCTLRAIEAQVLGFERLGDIDGMEVAARYSHYLRSGDASGLDAVLEHNFWDVLSMLALVGLYGKSDLALTPTDLAAFARTLARAKALPEALVRADEAVERLARAGSKQPGGDPDSDLARVHLIRGEIRKALGDRRGAIEDFTQAHTDPKARLELAKLYEHFVKDPEAALDWVERGTGERPEAVHKRRSRLDGKQARQKTRPGSKA